jgi:hypothetical protein
MSDIREFAARAASMYGGYQAGIKGHHEMYRTLGGLPASNEAAVALVKAAYDASHIPDEGRYPVTCMMCYRQEAAHHFHTLFSDPRESSPKEIAKLSHAIDHRSHIACICHEDRVTLGGFQVNMLYNQREYGYSSGRIANSLKVRINGSMGRATSRSRALAAHWFFVPAKSLKNPPSRTVTPWSVSLNESKES